MKEPCSPAEWQHVADLAEAWLRIDSARKYGLITGGPGVDADRCAQLLVQAMGRGFIPTKAEVDRMVEALVRGQ